MSPLFLALQLFFVAGRERVALNLDRSTEASFSVESEVSFDDSITLHERQTRTGFLKESGFSILTVQQTVGAADRVSMSVVETQDGTQHLEYVATNPASVKRSATGAEVPLSNWLTRVAPVALHALATEGPVDPPFSLTAVTRFTVPKGLQLVELDDVSETAAGLTWEQRVVQAQHHVEVTRHLSYRAHAIEPGQLSNLEATLATWSALPQSARLVRTR
jgi:hypothetical protein